MFKKLLSVVLCIVLSLSIFGCDKNNPSETEDKKTTKEELAEYTSEEVYKYLCDEGYEFSKSEHINDDLITTIAFVSNPNNNIAFQKITNPYFGKSYSWQDENINDKWADIKSEYENEDGEIKQYEAFEKWANYLGLSSKQVLDVLDYTEYTDAKPLIDDLETGLYGSKYIKKCKEKYDFFINLGFYFIAGETSECKMISARSVVDDISFSKSYLPDGMVGYVWSKNNETITIKTNFFAAYELNQLQPSYYILENWLSETGCSAEDLIMALNYYESIMEGYVDI